MCPLYNGLSKVSIPSFHPLETIQVWGIITRILKCFEKEGDFIVSHAKNPFIKPVKYRLCIGKSGRDSPKAVKSPTKTPQRTPVKRKGLLVPSTPSSKVAKQTHDN